MKLVITILLIFFTSIGQSHAQQSQSIEYSGNTDNQSQYSQAELAQMLAPIALYPDTLLTHILIATTYPLELVKAQQWLDKHAELSPERLANKLQDEMDNKNWDASVKALMPFPRVMQRLTDDLDWTEQLGNAFLADETQVLASIQQLRKQAEQAGTLADMSNNKVSYEGNNIAIEPQETQVIYVPYYDTRVVYGTWHWGNYPPIYWATPQHFYSRGYYSASYQPFYWHSAVHIRHHFFFGAFHWHKRHVVINHYNRPYYGYVNHRSRNKIVTSVGGKRWQHKPQHRRGVAYSNKQLNKRYKARQHASKWSGSNIKLSKINNIKQNNINQNNINQKNVKKNNARQHDVRKNIGKNSHQQNNKLNKQLKERKHNTAVNHTPHHKQLKSTQQPRMNKDKRHNARKASKLMNQNNKSREMRPAKQATLRRENAVNKGGILKNTNKANTKNARERRQRSNKSTDRMERQK